MTEDTASTCYTTSDDGYATAAMWGHQSDATPLAFTPALRALQGGSPVVYAMRLPDGAIKIGCTVDLANRKFMLHGQVLAFRPGNFADEKAIHQDLKPHRTRGWEYYNPTPEVMAVVNDMRDHFNLPHLAA